MRRVAAFVLALAFPAGAWACSFDGVNPGKVFTPAAAGSIEVAFAVRDAYDRGTLAAPPPLPPEHAAARARIWLQAFSVSLPATASRSYAVLLVEPGLWTRYEPAASGWAVRHHEPGPAAGDIVVLTSEAVLGELVEGRMARGAALEAGLLRFKE